MSNQFPFYSGINFSAHFRTPSTILMLLILSRDVCFYHPPFFPVLFFFFPRDSFQFYSFIFSNVLLTLKIVFQHYCHLPKETEHLLRHELTIRIWNTDLLLRFIQGQVRWTQLFSHCNVCILHSHFTKQIGRMLYHISQVS